MLRPRTPSQQLTFMVSESTMQTPGKKDLCEVLQQNSCATLLHTKEDIVQQRQPDKCTPGKKKKIPIDLCPTSWWGMTPVDTVDFVSPNVRRLYQPHQKAIGTHLSMSYNALTKILFKYMCLCPQSNLLLSLIFFTLCALLLELKGHC